MILGGSLLVLSSSWLLLVALGSSSWHLLVVLGGTLGFLVVLDGSW